MSKAIELSKVVESLEKDDWSRVHFFNVREKDLIYCMSVGEGVALGFNERREHVKMIDLNGEEKYSRSGEEIWRKNRPKFTIENLKSNPWRVALSEEGTYWFWDKYKAVHSGHAFNGRYGTFEEQPFGPFLPNRWGDEEPV